MQQQYPIISFRSSSMSFVPIAIASSHCLPRWMSFHARVLSIFVLNILSVTMQFLAEHWVRYLIEPYVVSRYYDPQQIILIGRLLSFIVVAIQMAKECFFLDLSYSSEQSCCFLRCWKAPKFYHFLHCSKLYLPHASWLLLSPFILCLVMG